MAVTSAVAAVAGTAVSAGSSLMGADAQNESVDSANAQQRAFYDQMRADLKPFLDTGYKANTDLSNRLTELTSPITMDQETLEKTPGYQFNLTQGLKSTQNSAAARGLGNSGAALKGAATYATGLADSTYQNQFNNAMANQENAYNRLMGVTTLGQNSAAQVGSAGLHTGDSIGANTIGKGNAQAAADTSLGKTFNNTATGIGANALAGLYDKKPGSYDSSKGTNIIWNS